MAVSIAWERVQSVHENSQLFPQTMAQLQPHCASAVVVVTVQQVAAASIKANAKVNNFFFI
jgi:hypothetical protein